METNTEPLSAIRALAIATAKVEDAQTIQTEAVSAARAAGASWSRIGAVLGMTKQAAQQKYGPSIQTPIQTPAPEIPGQLDALAEHEEDATHEPDYRPEAECIEPSKQTLAFIAKAEKRGLTATLHISPALGNEPRHQITVSVEDPKDQFHYLYWIQTHSVFTWTNRPTPSHSLIHSTSSANRKKVRLNDAARIMDQLAGN